MATTRSARPRPCSSTTSAISSWERRLTRPRFRPMRKPAAAARGRSGARGQRFPQKRRNKRSVQAA
eukprot:6708735-Pyramimonas_sp.AAC.1